MSLQRATYLIVIYYFSIVFYWNLALWLTLPLVLVIESPAGKGKPSDVSVLHAPGAVCRKSARLTRELWPAVIPDIRIIRPIFADHLEFFGRQFCFRCVRRFPKYFLTNGVISPLLLRKILEIGIDDIHVRAAHISVAANTVFTDVNLPGGISDFVHLFHNVED